MKNSGKSLKVGIVGAGLIGFKRARAILDLNVDKVVGVCDIDQKRAEELSKLTGAKLYGDWQSLVTAPDIECVVVAAFHKDLPAMTIAALKSGKHVLAEKTLGWDGGEAKKVYLASKKARKVLKVGFNHRFHPGLAKAHELFQKGAIGKLLYIRAIYGHGGRKGYDLEWRLQKKYTRGGQMYDQGSHMIDLGLWFTGDFDRAFANTQNYFWKKTPLEDNAFCQLITKAGQTFMYQVSLTQWKNRFLFEVYGTNGYLHVHGLGRSYGVETLTYGKRVGLGQVPVEEVWEFDGNDKSWHGEWQEFRRGIFEKKEVLSSGKENVRILKALDALYESARLQKIIKIKQ